MRRCNYCLGLSGCVVGLLPLHSYFPCCCQRRWLPVWRLQWRPPPQNHTQARLPQTQVNGERPSVSECVSLSAATAVLVACAGGTIVAKCFRGWLARARQRIGGRQGAFGPLMSNRTRPESPAVEPAAKKPCAKPTPPKQVNPPPKWKLRGYDLDPLKPFKDEWLDDPKAADWAFVENGCIHCSICHAAREKSAFSGAGKPRNDAWIKSQLTQHPTGKKHIRAVEQLAENVTDATELRSSRVRYLQSLGTSLNVIIRCVYWLCLENIAMIKLKSLFTFTRALPESPTKNLPPNYINNSRCREFVMSLSAVLKGKLWAEIEASPCITLLIDESTDISTSENMVLYIAYIGPDHRVHTTFVGMEHCPLTDAKSIHQLISQYFQVRGIDISIKLVCFCSDGASVMTGIKNGVGARLQKDNPYLLKIHCIAHRLALAVADSADDMDYPKDHEATMNSTSTYFNRSGKRMHQMVSLAKEFGLSLSRIQKSGKTRCVLFIACAVYSLCCL